MFPHDLSRDMTSRLAIKFPTPFEWWTNSLPPGHEKTSNARGMPGGKGGMLKLRFDWYIKLIFGSPQAILNNYRHIFRRLKSNLRTNVAKAWVKLEMVIKNFPSYFVCS